MRRKYRLARTYEILTGSDSMIVIAGIIATISVGKAETGDGTRLVVEKPGFLEKPGFYYQIFAGEA